ncbi:hypothetical protein [Kaistella sp.]
MGKTVRLLFKLITENTAMASPRTAKAIPETVTAAGTFTLGSHSNT